VLGAIARDAAGNDFSSLADELHQAGRILVIDAVDFLAAKPANLFSDKAQLPVVPAAVSVGSLTVSIPAAFTEFIKLSKLTKLTELRSRFHKNH
jgi:hypothetical protein